jgi:large subunit ribosomal protein L11
LNLAKGSGKNAQKKVGTLSKDQVNQIASAKMTDLNARTPEAAAKIIEGTARSMGIDVK